MSEANHALWAGRFEQPIADVAHRFSSSIAVDGKLWREDIRGSIAHARMLGDTGIITPDEATQIIDGLTSIVTEIETGIFQFDDSMEDVHLAIEQRLTEKIGAVGGKLHTGRSRNDQVALDERLYLKWAIPEISARSFDLISALLDQAESHLETLMPGYTHMQRAQPVLLSHHLLAYVEMFGRDIERLSDCLRRLDRSPLGAAAFAGTSYPIDRHAVSNELSFSTPLANSIDAVSDRDYLIELASACSIIMMHLSRMAEELVIWSTAEFGFVTMSDSVTTGSSIMPQKKNPDMAELTRGKVGKVYGSLINLLTIMKGLPLAYNRDMQEDKQPMFEAIDTTRDSLEMMALVIRETTFNAPRLQQATDQGFLTATELADYLVRKGIPFREAHYITGRIVAQAELREQSLRDLSLETLRGFSDKIDSDIYRYLDPATSITEKRSFGSTNPELVANSIASWRARLAQGQRT